MSTYPFRGPRSITRTRATIILVILAPALMVLNAFQFISSKFTTAGVTKTADGTAKKWDSSKSAVLGLATGYTFDTYKRFVGSLRATGFPGHIILGISNDTSPAIQHYFKKQNVTGHVVEMADKCTYEGYPTDKGTPWGEGERMRCAKAYPDYKITWGRFPLYKDWLKDCPTCTDGVILTDVRDSFFQRDPFVTKTELQHPLMVFEEIDKLDNTHWLADYPVKSCKDHVLGKARMLCSGSIMGSREGILDYIDVMVEEFEYWKEKDNCRTELIGDDQSIHNYLFYTNRFKNAVAIPHRTGPIHVVGYQAARIHEKAEEIGKERGIEVRDTTHFFIKDEELKEKWHKWLPKKYNLIDKKTGLITNFDGSISAQVHQDDRFGELQSHWMHEMVRMNWPYNKMDKK